MSDEKIDDFLKRAAESGGEADALVERIAQSLAAGTQPVKAMAASWMLIGAVMLTCAAIGVAGGVVLGPHGVRQMTVLEAAAIFSALSLLIWITSTAAVAEMIPGSRRLLPTWLVGVLGVAGLTGLFALLFQNYATEQFVSQGIKCLTAGLGFAVPALLATWLVLSRGYAVRSAAAGFAKGALAGLAGVAMLELHCPNFETLHVIVWHVAVIPIGGVLGLMAEKAIGRWRGRSLGS